MATDLPYDIAFRIASSLPVRDVCALGSCSRFWRELCVSDPVWISLYRRRWPEELDGDCRRSASNRSLTGWKGHYMSKHDEMSGKALSIVEFVTKCPSPCSIEVKDYLKAIEDAHAMQLSFEDVELFFFRPELNVMLNLVGLHYCISWLRTPHGVVAESLSKRKISGREACVEWWKVGRWFHGYRLKDECRSRCVSLGDVATAKEDEILDVLRRGAVYEVIRVRISVANPPSTPWSCQGF